MDTFSPPYSRLLQAGKINIATPKTVRRIIEPLFFREFEDIDKLNGAECETILTGLSRVLVYLGRMPTIENTSLWVQLDSKKHHINTRFKGFYTVPFQEPEFWKRLLSLMHYVDSFNKVSFLTDVFDFWRLRENKNPVLIRIGSQFW